MEEAPIKSNTSGARTTSHWLLYNTRKLEQRITMLKGPDLQYLRGHQFPSSIDEAPCPQLKRQERVHKVCVICAVGAVLVNYPADLNRIEQPAPFQTCGPQDFPYQRVKILHKPLA